MNNMANSWLPHQLENGKQLALLRPYPPPATLIRVKTITRELTGRLTFSRLAVSHILSLYATGANVPWLYLHIEHQHCIIWHI